MSVDAAPAERATKDAKERPPSIRATEAKTILFLDQLAPGCAGDDEATVTCLLGARYESDQAARATALDLYAHTGDVAGVEAEHTMNGGYRGMLHLVPVLPVSGERAHLQRVAAALKDYDDFFTALTAHRHPPL